MSRPPPHLVLVFCALLVPGSLFAADYAEGLAPPGAPANAFPAPDRPVAGIVTDTWRDEQSRDRAGEAERVMNLLGVNPGLRVADIGAGSGYYTVRLAGRLGLAQNAHDLVDLNCGDLGNRHAVLHPGADASDMGGRDRFSPPCCGIGRRLDDRAPQQRRCLLHSLRSLRLNVSKAGDAVSRPTLLPFSSGTLRMLSRANNS